MTISMGEAIAILAALGSGVGSYIAVKVDLARVQEKANGAAISAHEAHKRIDGILSK
jgi:hypothetical protein